MPPFQRIDKQKLANDFLKYSKREKLLVDSCQAFFVEYGINPPSDLPLTLLHMNVKLFEYPLKVFPEGMDKTSLQGFLYHTNGIGYFSELNDIVLIKLLSDIEVKKIIK
jgi:hypothetical protein